MTSRPLVVLGALGLLTTGCGASSDVVTVSKPGPAPTLMYTCCTAATVHRVYRPGDTVTLRWMRSTGGQGRDMGMETLKARLTGPFSKVAHAKAADALGNVRASAQQIQVAPGDPGPVSRIRIPVKATPGLYAVTTSDIQGPGRLFSKTIIRVVADRSH